MEPEVVPEGTTKWMPAAPGPVLVPHEVALLHRAQAPKGCTIARGFLDLMLMSMGDKYTRFSTLENSRESFSGPRIHSREFSRILTSKALMIQLPL